MGKSFTINILGQNLSVLSDAGDEHVAYVVKYVDDKVKEVEHASSSINTLNIAILTALNIADEYIKYKEVKEGICNQLESRSEKLINLIKEIR
ncbi:MAG: cell division protein ZapA [Syntrophaceae bacterium]|nr:cell division protein ZapA [Syntrophaceae bacterium]